MKTAFSKDYAFRERVGPFFRGLISGTPLVEVAIEGLRRGVCGERMRSYEERVISRGNVGQICEALATGRDEAVQVRMAGAVARKYGETDGHCYHLGAAYGVSLVNPTVIDLSAVHRLRAVEGVIGCVKSGTVTSFEAQDALAAFVAGIGRPQEARCLLMCGGLTSPRAMEILSGAIVKV